MAGMTSQPSMGAIVACAKGTKLDTGESHEGTATIASLERAEMNSSYLARNQSKTKETSS